MSGNEHGRLFVVVVVELLSRWQKQWQRQKRRRRHALQGRPRCRPSLLVLYKKERVYVGG